MAAIDLTILRNEILTRHNSYRTTHHAPLMAAQASINTTSQQWAEYLAANALFQHSTAAQRNNAGENIYVYYTTATTATEIYLATEAVNSWYNEVKDYNYAVPQFASNTGHFTQLVWKASVGIGSGAASGLKVINGVKYNAFYVVSQYSPAGNLTGAFATNVLKP